MKPSTFITAGLVVIVLGAAAWHFGPWSARVAERPVAASAPVAEAPAPTAAASAPVVRHPIEAVAVDAAGAGSAASSSAAAPKPQDPNAALGADLGSLFGEAALRTMFQTDGFAHRVAATVDNLGRAQASSRWWPVNPTPGRFATEPLGNGEVIAAANAARYEPFVRLVESVDSRRVVALYRAHYGEFQQAYEALGYPGRYFNDRLVEVIDSLLATPEADGPLRVAMPTAAGPMAPVRPWVLYAFADPAHASLTAGQAVLLRMGPAHERRLKARLAEIRQLVAPGAAPR